MRLQFLGGAREIGRSAVLVDDALLVDYGMLAGTPPRYPVGRPDPEAVVVSHGHLDHAGAVPALLSGDRRPPVHLTPPTYDLATTLASDTLKLHGGTFDCPFTGEDLRRFTEVARTHGYGEPFAVGGGRDGSGGTSGDGRGGGGDRSGDGMEVTLLDAGHIPGSAHVLVDDSETRLLYTGDFHTDDQRLVSGTTARPDADVVVVESTYADVEHTDRRELEAEFAESVKWTLREGGSVVVPAFAIGRTQELLLVCAAHDVPCYVDGMGKQVTRTLRQYPRFVRDPDALRRAISRARFVDGRDGQRERILDQRAAVVTTSGMLTGGPAMTYVPEIRSHPANKIALTGFQVEGTPGRELLERGRAEIDGRVMPVAAQVEQYDFSAHADREGLLSFLDSYRDATVLVNHGDRCADFAAELREEGFDARAPEVGDVVEV